MALGRVGLEREAGKTSASIVPPAVDAETGAQIVYLVPNTYPTMRMLLLLVFLLVLLVGLALCGLLATLFL